MAGSRLDARHVLLLAMTLTCEAFAVIASWSLEPYWDTLIYAAFSPAVVVIGVLIATHHPRNPVGWLLAAGGVLTAFSDAAQGWALRGHEEGWPGVAAADLLANSIWLASGALTVATFLIFPSGHLVSRSWAWVLALGVLGSSLGTVGWLLSPDSGEAFIGGENPYAVEGSPAEAAYFVGLSALAAALLLSVVSIVVRLRSAEGVERQQLKWFLFGAVLSAAIPPAMAPLWFSVPAVRPVTALALFALPVTAGIAMLRYRLYDVDLIISRTVLYSLVTALVAAGYVVTALVLGVFLGHGSAWTTAGATLVAALSFRPLRQRLQSQVDRWLAPTRQQAVLTLRKFMADLRADREEPEGVEAALQRALADPGVRLRFHIPESSEPLDIHGAPAPTSAGREVVPISRSGVLLGDVLLPAVAEERRAVLPAVLAEADLAVEIARLRVLLSRRLDEVKDSRRRIVTAAENERRRIERDLHDGAQQRLVSIGLALRHAQHELRGGVAPGAESVIGAAVDEVTLAIAELRELAHGIRPGCLDEGLSGALHELAGKMVFPVRVDASDTRYPPEVEAAAYFIACEGLTNAVKHARATHAEVEVDTLGDRLVLSVTDDGVGGAEPRAGSGLIGISDRVAAHGGTFALESRPGRGTRLVAEIPCVS